MNTPADQGARAFDARPKGLVYRDFCNTCGAARYSQHEDRCHLSGVVGAWSGIDRAQIDERHSDG